MIIFLPGALILRGKFFDFGPRPILLHHEEMTCSGHEDMLHECAGYVIGAHSCSETNGLYVQCPGLLSKACMSALYMPICMNVRKLYTW